MSMSKVIRRMKPCPAAFEERAKVRNIQFKRNVRACSRQNLDTFQRGVEAIPRDHYQCRSPKDLRAGQTSTWIRTSNILVKK